MQPLCKRLLNTEPCPFFSESELSLSSPFPYKSFELSCLQKSILDNLIKVELIIGKGYSTLNQLLAGTVNKACPWESDFVTQREQEVGDSHSGGWSPDEQRKVTGQGVNLGACIKRICLPLQ